jgi:Fe2+ transport system protein B
MCFVRDCMAITHQNPPKDITLHLKYTDELLAHYTSQWRDREVYWMCRQRSRSVKDILCCIIDSYDKAKICLPSFPQKRTPKAQVYETIRRTWTHDSFVLRLCLHILCHLFSLCFLTGPPPHPVLLDFTEVLHWRWRLASAMGMEFTCSFVRKACLQGPIGFLNVNLGCIFIKGS